MDTIPRTLRSDTSPVMLSWGNIPSHFFFLLEVPFVFHTSITGQQSGASWEYLSLLINMAESVLVVPFNLFWFKLLFFHIAALVQSNGCPTWRTVVQFTAGFPLDYLNECCFVCFCQMVLTYAFNSASSQLLFQFLLVSVSVLQPGQWITSKNEQLNFWYCQDTVKRQSWYAEKV